MQTIPRAETEVRRLLALESYRILDTDFEEAFDRYTRIAAKLIGTPIAAISFVDAERLWLKSVVGTTVREKSRDASFCHHTILGKDPFIVSDAHLDIRFSNRICFEGDATVRFYAGAPLCTLDGHNIGTVCAIDMQPREISGDQKAGLMDLAGSVVTTMELYKALREMKRLALTDPLTDLPNRIQFFHSLNAMIASSDRTHRPFSLLYLDCDEFKRLNDTQGHETGDFLLREIAALLQTSLRKSDTAARLGGDEFAIILPEAGPRAGLSAANRLLENCRDMMARNGWPTSLSIGLASFLTTPLSADLALAHADRAMYTAKTTGKNNVHSVIISESNVVRLVTSNTASVRL